MFRVLMLHCLVCLHCCTIVLIEGKNKSLADHYYITSVFLLQRIPLTRRKEEAVTELKLKGKTKKNTTSLEMWKRKSVNMKSSPMRVER